MKQSKFLFLSVVAPFALVVTSVILWMRGFSFSNRTGITIPSMHGSLIMICFLVGWLTTLILALFISNRKAPKWILRTVVLISVVAIITLIATEPDFDYLEENTPPFSDLQIIEITWDEVEMMIEAGVYDFLYIGRDDCPTCNQFEEKVLQFSIDNEILIFRYNTSQDRVQYPEKHRERMEMLGVEYVPTIFIVGNGGFRRLEADVDGLIDEMYENLQLVIDSWNQWEAETEQEKKSLPDRQLPISHYLHKGKLSEAGTKTQPLGIEQSEPIRKTLIYHHFHIGSLCRLGHYWRGLPVMSQPVFLFLLFDSW